MQNGRGRDQFRTARRKNAAGIRMRARARLLRFIALAVLACAALFFLLAPDRPAILGRLWGSTRARTQTSTSVTPAPASLTIAVAEAEPVLETVSQAVETVPRVLIYHTHASEAYLLTEDEPYEASGSWRTLDNTKNVVAIGALLQETLLTEHGILAIHDTSNYEAPKLASAYSRSLPAMEKFLKENPTVELCIDVHRDAYGNNTDNMPQDYIELSGREVARIMLVVGTGEGATGGGFGEMPDFRANLTLAEQITNHLRRTDARLARDIRIKTGRYNQHVSSQCMLVEVGHTANTFTQAANSVPYLAAAIAAIIKSVPEPDTLSAMHIWTP